MEVRREASAAGRHQLHDLRCAVHGLERADPERDVHVEFGESPERFEQRGWWQKIPAIRSEMDARESDLAEARIVHAPHFGDDVRERYATTSAARARDDAVRTGLIAA